MIIRILKKIKRTLVKGIDKLTYKMECYKLKKYTKLDRKQTSSSDDAVYPLFCHLAANKENIYKNFRRNIIYNRILEHIPEDMGMKYLEMIQKGNVSYFDEAEWNGFIKNDAYGNPRVFPYKVGEKYYQISPTTLRYVKVLKDIVTLFDYKKISTVAEIGIGYAGQCRIITSYIDNIDKYTLIDLPEVLELSQKYLSEFGNMDRYEFVDGTNEINEKEYDLVISNYAFSELIRDVQKIYLEKVILKSKAGYITWNSASFDEFDGYSLQELLSIIPGSSIIPEEPLTATNNQIIIWGNK